jgi:hypothetical protein
VSFLHLTNGSAIIPFMREAGIIGRIVPWDDVLHEGPVRGGLNVAAMRDARADFLASCGWGSRDEIARSLAVRDAAIEAATVKTASFAGAVPDQDPRATRVDEIVLWFEHDLYDQLQILQILDRLPLDGGPLVTAVPGDDYLAGLTPALEAAAAGPAIESAGARQTGATDPGFTPARRFSELFALRREVTTSQRISARDAWEAFRSDDPRAIVDVLERVTDHPHLPAALRRHLQQFPSVRNGLSRTEQQALEAVVRGVSRVRDVFVQANHRSEEAVFMGDAPFLCHLGGLLQGPRPLLRASTTSPDKANAAPSSTLRLDDQLALTDDGRRVLAGDADRVTLCGIDRWLGGVHLRGRGAVWRYDHGRHTVRLA